MSVNVIGDLSASGTNLFSGASSNYNTFVRASGYLRVDYFFDTAIGNFALTSNNTGLQNTASGAFALRLNTTGHNNIALGYSAGYYLTTGSNNIAIGSLGVAGESGDIRIGTTGTHKSAYIAGISEFVLLLSASNTLCFIFSYEYFSQYIIRLN